MIRVEYNILMSVRKECNPLNYILLVKGVVIEQDVHKTNKQKLENILKILSKFLMAIIVMGSYKNNCRRFTLLKKV